MPPVQMLCSCCVAESVGVSVASHGCNILVQQLHLRMRVQGAAEAEKLNPPKSKMGGLRHGCHLAPG